jgi:alkylated DNA nucleotide flippase Atl1
MYIVLTVSRLVSTIRAIRIMRGNVAAPQTTGSILHHTPDPNTLSWILEYLME